MERHLLVKRFWKALDYGLVLVLDMLVVTVYPPIEFVGCDIGAGCKEILDIVPENLLP